MRLNIERQKTVEPKRMEHCKSTLEKMGFKVDEVSDTELNIEVEGTKVILFPYSGWFSGKLVKDGRGFKKLVYQLKQLKR